MKAVLCLFAALFVLLSGLSVRAEDDGETTPLRICLNEDLPPFSVSNRQGSAGFDLMTAKALAKRLGRPLAIQWYESKLDAHIRPPIRLVLGRGEPRPVAWQKAGQHVWA